MIADAKDALLLLLLPIEDFDADEVVDLRWTFGEGLVLDDGHGWCGSRGFEV